MMPNSPYERREIRVTARASDRGNGQRCRFPYASHDLQVVSLHRPVPIDRVDHDFAGSEPFTLDGELHGRKSGGALTVVRDHLVLLKPTAAPDIDDDDDALAAYTQCGFPDDPRIRYRGRRDRDLLHSQTDDALNLLDGLDSTSVAQRHPALDGQVLDQAVIRLPALHGSVDVENRQFVYFLLVEYAYRV